MSISLPNIEIITIEDTDDTVDTVCSDKTDSMSSALLEKNVVNTAFTYGLDEQVLCIQGPLIYDAICLDRKVDNNIKQYLVHYNGWNRRWDEWVDESRILVINEENQKLQQLLRHKHITNKQKSTSKKKIITQSLDNSNTNNTEEPKQLMTNTNHLFKTPKNSMVSMIQTTNNKSLLSIVPPFVESKEAFDSKKEIKITIPEELKIWIVKDWELITKRKKLFKLPARVTVKELLEDYLSYCLTQSHLKESDVREVVEGIEDYFNQMLFSQLLYRFERHQYEEQLEQIRDPMGQCPVPMSEIYGWVHLLRLFTKLGHFLALTEMNEKPIQVLLTHIHRLLRHLSRNSSLFTTEDYLDASPECYQN